MKKLVAAAAFSLLFALPACKKDSGPGTNSGKMSFTIKHTASGSPLQFDTLMYTNASGNRYRVERLQYYISDIVLYKGGEKKYAFSDIFYLDARYDSTRTFSFTPPNGVLAGTYDSLCFLVGLDTAANKSYQLPSSLDNLNMGWPDAMGGGYHFFKLEGHWMNGSSLESFALHVGENQFLVHSSVKSSFTIDASGTMAMSLTMDVNKWFDGDAPYNLSTDPTFSMADSAARLKLVKNGAKVFSFSSN